VLIEAVPFQIDRPVSEGDTVVAGGGPAGIPILVVSVTMMGEVLGAGTIGPDNRFEITTSPLPASIRIGIALADLSGTEYLPSDFNDEGFQGDEAMLIPEVGYFFDSTMIAP
jgi:hypothetical protein